MTKAYLSPLTKGIAGLEVTLDLNGESITAAQCGGVFYRGFEELLKGRDPRDSVQLTQRIEAGEATAHSLAAARALEDLGGINVPSNGKVIRNLLLGVEFLRQHLSHFYLGSSLLQPTERAWQALELVRLLGNMAAIWGGKQPHSCGIVVGGITENIDVQKIIDFEAHLKKVNAFVSSTYMADLNDLLNSPLPWLKGGAGCGNLMAVEGFIGEEKKPLLPGGVIYGGQGKEGFEVNKVREDITYVKFRDSQPHPDKAGAYSWIKAPRYDGKVYEVGPLARMLLFSHERIKAMGPGAYSIAGRHLARGIESVLVGEAMLKWVKQLKPGEKGWEKHNVPDQGSGIGVVEAPGGTLIHLVEVNQGLIAKYNIITPATWIFSPKDEHNQPGPAEAALLGLTVPGGKDLTAARELLYCFGTNPASAAH